MKLHSFFCIGFVTGIFCFLSVNNSFAQWPQWRGSTRDGVSQETDLLKAWPAEGPAMVWKVEKLGDGFSSAAIQDGMVYATGKRDSVEVITAMDLQGNVKWQKVFGRASSQEKDWPQSRCTPTVYKNKVYVTTVYGDIACLDSKSGNIEWQMPAFEKFGGIGHSLPGRGIAESPLVFDDKVIITPCGNKTTMVALDRLTGKTIWESESLNDTTFFTSPVLIRLNNKEVIFTSTLHNDLLVDCNSGHIIWKDWHLSGMVPVVYNNQIYSTGEYQKGGFLNGWDSGLNNRSVIWRDTISANSIGGAVLLKDKIVVSSNERGIFSIDSKTGITLAKYDSINYCNLLAAGNMVYTYEDRIARVSLFSIGDKSIDLAGSFKVRNGTGSCVAHLALSDGLLFIRRGEVLLAYDIKKK